MADKFWNTQTKRISTAVAMVLAGWFILATTFENLPQIPEMMTKPIAGGISLLVVAGALLLYGTYMLLDNQLNG